MKRIFIDQDGVLADFDKATEGNLDNMYRMKFFAKLEPLEKDLNDIVRKLQQMNYEVHILTKLPVVRNHHRFADMMIDKVTWLERYIPAVDELNIHVLPCNQDKSDILKFYEDKENCILIDDYTPNLTSWIKAGGKGIKKAKRLKDTRVIAQILSLNELIKEEC